MPKFNEDAQHPATAVRLQSARQEGDAPKSSELVAAIQVTCGITILYFLINWLASTVSKFAAGTWQANGIAVESVIGNLEANTKSFLISLLTTLLPILAAVLVSAIASHVVQTGSAFGFKKPVWQPKQANPVGGLKRLFSMDNLLRGVMGIPKVAIIVLVTSVAIWNQRFEIAELQHAGASHLGADLATQIFIVLISGCGTLLAVSLIDYVVQWFSFQSRIRMTDQQLRDENRLQSPDPQLKSRRIEIFEQITNSK